MDLSLPVRPLWPLLLCYLIATACSGSDSMDSQHHPTAGDGASNSEQPDGGSIPGNGSLDAASLDADQARAPDAVTSAPDTGSLVALDDGSALKEDAGEPRDAGDPPWMPPIPARRAEPSCAGRAVSCALRRGTSCSLGLGCTLGGDCTGYVSSCYLQHSSYSCTDIDGCYWSSYSENCSGSSRSCSEFSSSYGCNGQPGCSWNETCTGTPTSCETLSGTSCETQLGCGRVCPSGLFECDATCVDLLDDENHCGGCGFVCGPRGDCKGGKCECGAPYSQCSGHCVDTRRDVANCGACGHHCGTGFLCQAGECVDIDECAANPCLDGRVCSNQAGDYTCGPCAPGYQESGRNACQDVNECLTNNGGCDPAAPCVNETGSYHCGPCPTGFMGTATTGCVDIDECASNNGGCDALTTCINTRGGRTCSDCPSGYRGTGTSGCLDVDECATKNGGCDPLTTCTNSPGSRSCGNCPSGYTGSGLIGCKDVNECATGNGGCDTLRSCVNDPGSSHCGTCVSPLIAQGNTGCTCPTVGNIVCASTCIDPTRDRNNCGGCNQRCTMCDGQCKQVVKLYGGGLMCATLSTGELYCWPSGGKAVPERIETAPGVPLAEVTDLSLSIRNFCAVTRAGSLYCWGRTDGYGQGLGYLGDGARPTLVELSPGVPFDNVRKVFTHSEWRACAIRNSGEAYCWGSNAYGSIGDGTTESRSYPTRVETAPGTPLTGVVDMEVMYNRTCALNEGGSVYCWGAGGIGDGTTTDRARPVAVEISPGTPLGNVAEIEQTCARTTAGEAYCWGANGQGYVGDGTTVDRLRPVRVVGADGYPLGPVKQLSFGASRCAVLQDGTAWCWGDGATGALGDGLSTSSSRAVQVRTAAAPLQGTDEIVLFDSLSYTPCARLRTGEIYCWGLNYYGTAGNGNDKQQPYAAQVFTSSVKALTATQLVGSDATYCALSTSGDVMCWGQADGGQIGDGALGTRRTQPSLVVWP